VAELLEGLVEKHARKLPDGIKSRPDWKERPPEKRGGLIRCDKAVKPMSSTLGMGGGRICLGGDWKRGGKLAYDGSREKEEILLADRRGDLGTFNPLGNEPGKWARMGGEWLLLK